MDGKDGSEAAPPRRRPRNRRRAILTAAAQQFAELGFHGVSVDDIGNVVGISGPALYHHFPSKDALLAEVLSETSVVLLTEARRRVELAGSPDEALRSLISWHTEFAVQNPSLIAVQMRDVASLAKHDQQRVGQLQRDYVEVWSDVIVDLYGTVGKTKVVSLVHAALGLLNSVVRPHSVRLKTSDMVETLHTAAFAAIEGTLRPLTAGEVRERPEARAAGPAPLAH